jgi:hypothetical protein
MDSDPIRDPDPLFFNANNNRYSHIIKLKFMSNYIRISHATETTCVKNSPVFTTKWLHVILHLAQTHYTLSTHKVFITAQNPAVLEKVSHFFQRF